jgi:hypothetical protein
LRLTGTRTPCATVIERPACAKALMGRLPERVADDPPFGFRDSDQLAF